MTALVTRLTLMFWGLCTALLGMTVLSGMPTPAHASFLTSNSCALPCFYGIVPGLTTRNDAMRNLESIDLSYSYFSEYGMKYVMYVTKSMSTRLAYLNFGSAGGARVSSAQLYQMGTGRDLGNLSDFLLQGYQPTQVFSSCSDDHRLLIALGDQALFVQVAFRTRLDPNTQVMAVSTAVDTDAMKRALRTFACTTQTDWLGFAAPWKYLDTER